jgi:hypothetical protein
MQRTIGEQDQTDGTGQNRNRKEQEPIGGTEEGRTGPDWVVIQNRTRLGNRTIGKQDQTGEQDNSRTGTDWGTGQ